VGFLAGFFAGKKNSTIVPQLAAPQRGAKISEKQFFFVNAQKKRERNVFCFKRK
jgi:hypothetical protein